MSRTGWQVVRKTSLIFTSFFVAYWLLMIAVAIFIVATDGPDKFISFLRSSDGAEGSWSSMNFAIQQVLVLLLTLGAWLLSQHSQRHLKSLPSESSALSPET